MPRKKEVVFAPNGNELTGYCSPTNTVRCPTCTVMVNNTAFSWQQHYFRMPKCLKAKELEDAKLPAKKSSADAPKLSGGTA